VCVQRVADMIADHFTKRMGDAARP
jgi:hypothetical protein